MRALLVLLVGLFLAPPCRVTTHAWLACPSRSFEVDGIADPVTVLLNAGALGGDGEVEVLPNAGRSYLGTQCHKASSIPWEDMLDFKLLDRTFSFTIDVSDAACNCNAAVYLVAMSQNRENPSKERSCSGDKFYCDANHVCGGTCAEIDLVEANSHAFLSTLHKSSDPYGVANGYGGGDPAHPDPWSGPRAFDSVDYGPGASCVNTLLPFRVSYSFPTEPGGQLAQMHVTLSQGSCSLSTHLGSGYDGLAELTEALREGMALVVSYWGGGSTNMQWMDGPGSDGRGPCPLLHGASKACSGTLRVSEFRIDPPFSLSPTTDPAPSPSEPPFSFPTPVPSVKPSPMSLQRQTSPPTPGPISPSPPPSPRPVPISSVRPTPLPSQAFPTPRPATSNSSRPTCGPVLSSSVWPTSLPSSAEVASLSPPPTPAGPALIRSDKPTTRPVRPPTKIPTLSPRDPTVPPTWAPFLRGSVSADSPVDALDFLKATSLIVTVLFAGVACVALVCRGQPLELNWDSQEEEACTDEIELTKLGSFDDEETHAGSFLVPH